MLAVSEECSDTEYVQNLHRLKIQSPTALQTSELKDLELGDLETLRHKKKNQNGSNIFHLAFLCSLAKRLRHIMTHEEDCSALAYRGTILETCTNTSFW